MITLKGKRFVTAKCPRCGKSAVYEVFVSGFMIGIGKTSYNKALRNLNKKDIAVSDRVNNKHKYGSLKEKCVCPFCGCIQPWSGRKLFPDEADNYRPVYYSADRIESLSRLISSDKELQESLELARRNNQIKEKNSCRMPL